MKRKINVTRRQYETISRIYRFGGFALVMGLLIGFSFLIGKPIEFILIFLPYFISKNFYTVQFHSKSLKQCFTLSLMVFALATMAVVPSDFSIMFSVLFGCAIAFVSYKVGIVQRKINDYDYIEPRYNQLVEFYKEATTPKPFSTDTCSRDELIARCNELKFSKENTDLAVEFFINRTKQSIIADRLCIDEKSVVMRKMRLKRKLNNQD